LSNGACNRVAIKSKLADIVVISASSRKADRGLIPVTWCWIKTPKATSYDADEYWLYSSLGNI